MAAIGKVSAVFAANTTGLSAGVNTAVSAFGRVGGNAKALGSAFQQLQAIGNRGVGDVGPAATTAGASVERFQRLAVGLQQSLQAGRITAEDFARRMQMIETAASAQASEMSRGVALTDQFRTAEERAVIKLQEYDTLLKANAISQETFTRAVAAANQELDQATGYTSRLAAMQAEYDAAKARGTAITEQFSTAEQRHSATLAEYTSLLQSGMISQETFDRAAAAANKTLEDATGITAARASAQAELDAQMAAGQSITRAMMSAEERHAARLEELNGLHAAGAIDVRTYMRAVDAANEELQKSQAGANAFQKAAGTVETATAAVTRRLNALIAIQGAQLFGSLVRGVSDAVRSMVNFGQAQAEVIDANSKLAARLGMTYGELSGLGLAAELSGVSMDQVASAATKADVAFVKAANGSKQAQALFDRLGLSMDQLQGMSAAERFDAIAASIAGLPTEAERAAAAVAIFGRSGAALLPMFAQGAQGIADARREAEAFGLNLTNIQGTNVEAMNDAFTRAQQAISGVVGQIVAYLAPAVEAVTTAFSDFVGSVGGANIGQAIGDALLQGAQFFAGIADWVIAGIGGVFEYATAVGQSWAVGWDLGMRVGNLLYGAFKTFEAVGNIIGGLFSDIVAGLYRAAARIASVIPGFKSMAQSLTKTADGWAATGDQFAASMNQNLDAASTAFGNAFGESAAAAAPAAVGPVSKMIDDARKRAEQAAATRDTANRQTVGPQAVAASPTARSTEALKATDSTSREGIAEMFRLMRGDTGSAQERTAEASERTADAVERMLEERLGDSYDTEVIMPGV